MKKAACLALLKTVKTEFRLDLQMALAKADCLVEMTAAQMVVVMAQKKAGKKADCFVARLIVQSTKYYRTSILG